MESVKRNFVYNVSYQILVILLPLITAPYISRTLGAEAVGVYSYTNSIAYYFLMFAMLGISNHGNRSIAAVRDNKATLNRTFSSIYYLQACTFIISIIAYCIYVFFFVQENQVVALLQVIYVASGLLDISWLFFGLEKFKLTVVRNALIKVGTVICMFIFVHDRLDLWKYTLIMSGGTILSQAYLWLYVKKEVKFVKVSIRDIIRNVKPVLILFVPVIAYSIYKVMDKIMLGNMSTYVDVGYYQNAEKIINVPMGIVTALGTVMLPRMSNVIAMGNREKTVQYIRVSVKFVTLMCSAIVFGLIGIAPVLAPVYLGKDFVACSSIISLLSVTVFFIAWANVIRTQYLIPYKFDNIYLLSTIIGAALNFIINCALIPTYQSNGAAIGTIVAEFSVMFVQAIAVRKELYIWKYIVRYIPVIGIGFMMMVIVRYIGMVMGNNVITLITQVGIGAVFFCLLTLLYLMLSKDEIYIIIKETIFLQLKKIMKFRIGHNKN